MCKFCEENFVIETTIGEDDLYIHLDEDNKKFLKISIFNGAGITKPMVINNCPFCGKDLKELNCRYCSNYNIGDGIDDISICEDCDFK